MTSALLLTLLAASQASRIEGKIEGQVLHALTGEPVRKATVTLQTGTPYDWGASILTDAEGRFAFDKLSPGIYGMHATKSGFLSRYHASRKGNADLPAIKLKEGEASTPTVLWLHPAAMLGGKVLDDDGEPMDGILVSAWRRHFINGREHWLLIASSHTNATGDFRLGDLGPATYFVSAEAEPTRKGRQQFPVRIGDREFDYHRTFYPNATRIQDAQPFSLRAGQNDNSVLIQLRREPVSRLIGRFASPSPPPIDVHGFLRRIPDNTDTSTGLEPSTKTFSVSPAGGTFSIPGLSPGSYELCVASNGPGPTRVRGRTRVTVSGAPIERAEIPPTTLTNLRVLLSFEERQPADAKKRPEMTFNLGNFDFPNGAALSHSVPVLEGATSIPNLLPTAYQLGISHFPFRYYIKSIHLNDVALASNPIQIPEAAEAELRLLLSNRMAQFKLQIEPASDTAAPGYIVIEEDSPARINYYGPQFNHPAPDWTYQSPPMPPGTYYLYAFEEADSYRLGDPAYLKLFRKHATKLTLGEDETKSVTLRQIPASLTVSESSEGPRP